jgi:RAT1-interacting protein
MTANRYTFEALCTSALPNTADEDDASVDLTMWSSVATRTLGNLKLVFAGEVDCVRGKGKFLRQESSLIANIGLGRYTGQHDTFVELKTRKGGLNMQLARKWFMQSFLLGTPEIFVGYRNEAGLITGTATMSTATLASERLSGWDRQQSLDAGYGVLRSLRQYCQAASEGTSAEGKVWRVEITGKSLAVREAAAKEMKEVNRKSGQKPRTGILPQLLVENLKQVVT